MPTTRRANSDGVSLSLSLSRRVAYIYPHPHALTQGGAARARARHTRTLHYGHYALGFPLIRNYKDDAATLLTAGGKDRRFADSRRTSRSSSPLASPPTTPELTLGMDSVHCPESVALMAK